MSPEELRNFKLKCFCKSCGKLGHWASDHNNGGTVKDNLPSIEPANGATPSLSVKKTTLFDAGSALANQRQDLPNAKDVNNVMSFCASLYACSTIADTPNSTSGPIVDDGAPYSALGVAELCFLTGLRCKSPQSPLPLDPKPNSLADSTGGNMVKDRTLQVDAVFSDLLTSLPCMILVALFRSGIWL